jgi:uncharacterized protein (DUF427 family)
VKAVWNGRVLAQSDDIVTVEGNTYFPSTSLDPAVLRRSQHTSVCGWKGTAHYFSLEVDGKVNENAVWYYPSPKSAAAAIKDRVAFWKGVSVGP